MLTPEQSIDKEKVQEVMEGLKEVSEAEKND
jgi:hypothetical protein